MHPSIEPNVTVQPSIRLAKHSEKQVILNIDQYYLYEFSRMMPDRYKLGADGRFHDDEYERYWSSPAYFPYLIFNESELSGFALVKNGESHFNQDQFFIMTKFQGSGLAGRAAALVFSAHKGRWKVQSFLGNERSERFWAKFIPIYAGENFTAGVQKPLMTHREYTFSNI